MVITIHQAVITVITTTIITKITTIDKVEICLRVPRPRDTVTTMEEPKFAPLKLDCVFLGSVRFGVVRLFTTPIAELDLVAMMIRLSQFLSLIKI